MDKKKILVIEDEKPLQRAIQKKLETSGFLATAADSVESGLRALKNENIHAIWLDHYLLGKEDGLHFVRKIKAEDSAWKSIPVFVISNTASPDKVQTYMELGAERYYMKAQHRLDAIVGDLKSALQGDAQSA